MKKGPKEQYVKRKKYLDADLVKSRTIYDFQTGIQVIKVKQSLLGCKTAWTGAKVGRAFCKANQVSLDLKKA